MVLVYDRIDLWDSCYVYSVGILWIRETKGRIKMGKYIIELKEEETAYKTVDLNGMPLIQLLNLTPYTEPNFDAIRKEAYDEGYHGGMQFCIGDTKLKEEYQRGLNDAWECARKIACDRAHGGFCIDTKQHIFGASDYAYILANYNAFEAAKRIRQYEQECEETELKDAINTIMAEGGYTIESIYNVVEGMRKP